LNLAGRALVVAMCKNRSREEKGKSQRIDIPSAYLKIGGEGLK